MRGAGRALAWSGLALLIAAAWLAWPRAASEARELPALRVVLFDASAGTTRPRPAWGLWARRTLRDEARAASASGEQLWVVSYGADVRRVPGGPGAEDWLERLAGRGGVSLELGLEPRGALGSELDAALAAVEAELLAPGRPRRRVTLLAAAEFSGADPSPRLARLERAGVELDWRQPPAPSLPDLALMELRLPSAPAPGAPLVARLDLALSPGTGARPTVELRAVLETGSDRREVVVEAFCAATAPDPDGYLRWSAALELGPTPEGRSELTVTGHLAEAMDALPENDSLRASLRSGATRVAALVSSEDRRGAAGAWIGAEAQRFPGLQWYVVSPAQLLELGADVDLVVSFDLAADELPRTVLERVLDAGGGWLHCGGWRIAADLGARGRVPTSLASWLPLQAAADERPPRDVVLLVDGSGSMVGEPFEHVRRALRELVSVARPQDRLQLRFFTGALGGVVELDGRPEARRETLSTLAGLRVPGGPTAILYSLEQLAEQRESEEREALVLMLSDGRDVNAFETARRGAELRARFTARGVELRVLATGPSADTEFLTELLGGPELLVRADDLSRLGELFQREVLSEAIREGELDITLGTGAEGAADAELLRAWERASVAPPPVARYLRATARPNAQPLWVSSEFAEPLLAVQRVRSGWVAAWGSAPLPGWAEDYARADDLIAPLVRWLAGGRERQAALELRLGAAELVLERVPLEWPALLTGRLRAVLGEGLEPWSVELAGAELAFDLGAAQPGVELRRTRRAPRPALLGELPAGAPLALELSEPEGGEVLGSVGLAAPPHAELLPGGSRLRDGPWTASGTVAPLRRSRQVDPRAALCALLGALALTAGALVGRRGPSED